MPGLRNCFRCARTSARDGPVYLRGCKVVDGSVGDFIINRFVAASCCRSTAWCVALTECSTPKIPAFVFRIILNIDSLRRPARLILRDETGREPKHRTRAGRAPGDERLPLYVATPLHL